MIRPKRRRFDALRNRLSLIVLGVAIGLVARWLVSAIGGTTEPPLFEPMTVDVTQDAAESQRP